MAVASLKPGVDPDEAYNVWRGKHAPWARELFLPEARKYTINRVIKTFGGVDIYGFAEVWSDDMESALRATERLVVAQPDVYLSNYITAPGRTLVQEEEIEL